MVEDTQETSKQSKYPTRRTGKGILLDHTLNKDVITIVSDARLISRDDLYAIFGNIPVSTMRERTNKLIATGYLDEVEHIKDLRWLPYVQRSVGRKYKLLAPATASATFLGRPAKNNKELRDESKLHLLMESKFAAVLHAGKHKGWLTLDNFRRERKGPSVLVSDAKPPRQIALTPDADFTVNGKFRYFEAETGEGHAWRENFDQSSFWKKICWYEAIHNQLVKNGKHPPFLVDVVCLDPDYMNTLRKWVWNRNETRKHKLNLFRFTLFKYVLCDAPELMLQEKYWFTAFDKENHAYLE